VGNGEFELSRDKVLGPVNTKEKIRTSCWGKNIKSLVHLGKGTPGLMGGAGKIGKISCHKKIGGL